MKKLSIDEQIEEICDMYFNCGLEYDEKDLERIEMIKEIVKIEAGQYIAKRFVKELQNR